MSTTSGPFPSILQHVSPHESSTSELCPAQVSSVEEAWAPPPKAINGCATTTSSDHGTEECAETLAIVVSKFNRSNRETEENGNSAGMQQVPTKESKGAYMTPQD